MDKPLWGLRVLKFDGAIAPRVLKFDSGFAAEDLWWALLNYRRRPLMKKTFTTALRARKCIPPLVADATTFPVEKSGAAGKGEASAASQSAEWLFCHMMQIG